jgi:hypothetical protein
MKEKLITRRDFIKNSSAAALAGALYLNLPKSVYSQAGKKSRVILIRNENLMNSQGKPNPEILESMLDQAMMTLLDTEKPQLAWSQLFKSNDIVGIKTNVWNYLRTPESLEKLVRQKLVTAGVQDQNISVNDRGILYDPVFQKATALINIRPMRTHHWSGVGTLLKNYIMFIKQPSDYHPDSCADLASIWYLPQVKGKTRLNILLLFTPLFHSVGPHDFSQQYVWNYSGMLVGFDPVALDATGVRIIQAKRLAYFREERPINPPAKHIFLADTRHHLGTADPGKIELIKLGWKKDILI